MSAASRLRPEDFARLEQTATLNARDAGADSNTTSCSSTGARRTVWDLASHAEIPSGGRARRRRGINRPAGVSGRGSSLSSQVTPGNRLWHTDNVSSYSYDPRARNNCCEAGFRRDGSGPLVDRDGHPVEFSLMVSATNQARRKMATLIQEAWRSWAFASVCNPPSSA